MCDLSKEQILKYLQKDIPLTVLETTDSTNAQAKILAQNGAAHSTAVVANQQTSGRGRFGREFYSPPQTGLYLSVVLRLDPDTLGDLPPTVYAAVAAARAIKVCADKDVQIKWVNDLYLDGKKICGILCEAMPSDGEITVIAGIGVNVSTEQFPDDIADKAGSLGKSVSRSKLAAEIIAELLSVFDESEKTVLSQYRNKQLLIGRKITFTQNGQTLHAVACDIDRHGYLVVTLPDSTQTALHSGEVTLHEYNV